MSNHYDDIMKRVEVTPEMRRRILENIENADLDESKENKIIRLAAWKQLAAIAACILFVVVGVFAFSKLKPPVTDTDPFVTSPVGEITEAVSAKALSEMLGYEIKDLTALPFEPQQTEYTSFWNEFGQITYTVGDNSLVYRKEKGTIPNSGDYTVYHSEKNIIANCMNVTLKGTEESYTLAYWTDGEYSYSINTDLFISESDWVSIIDAI